MNLLLRSVMAVAFLVTSGCPGEEPKRTCGDGAELRDDVCVAVEVTQPSCGPGTVAENGSCVHREEITTSPTCEQGTALVDGQCVALDAGVTGIQCGPGTVLSGNVCVLVDAGVVATPDAGSCVRDCLSRNCGDDGCGGVCGTCDNPAAPQCDETIGRCTSICVPQCGGRTCGDNGCGGTCGTCALAEACASSLGRCVPDAWTCSPSYFGGGDVCDCGCGAYDPDCAAGRPLAGCEQLERCNDQGACVPAVPQEWTCSPLSYDARDACDCGCGAYDPDCALSILGVTGCSEGVTACLGDGSCGTCAPDCSQKVCGEDGCGGTCGECDFGNDEVCRLGSCVPRCTPAPVACLDAECGDDGCGGVCGTCATGTTCTAGACIADPVTQTPFSCLGRCGSAAPSGCYCTDNCVEYGNCCSDFAEFCTCVPDCTGKSCGTDGCGGSCGTCGASEPYCTDQGQCTNQCTRRCGGRECGSDGCGGTCGTCVADATCYWTYQCVPAAWTCDGVLFGDRQGCDCGCGSVDPDCAVQDATVYGCPAEERVCGGNGLCAINFCHANAECGAAWCTGAYEQGNERMGGFCANPIEGGGPPGFACDIHEQCASLLCVDGQCRQHCVDDGTCPQSGKCAGLPVRDVGTGLTQGYVSACDTVAGSGLPCGSQAACGDERCIVMMDPVSEQPRYLCSSVQDPTASGRPCDFEKCPAGYRCEQTDSGAVCSLPCPGGNADCAGGFTCVARSFAPILQSSATVPLCLPE